MLGGIEAQAHHGAVVELQAHGRSGQSGLDAGFSGGRLVQAGLRVVGAGAVQKAGDQRMIGFFAAAQHDGGLAVVELHKSP